MFKRMSLAVVVSVAVMVLAAPMAGRADLADALKQAPADAQLVIVVKSCQVLNDRVAAYAGKLGLAEKLPPGGDLVAAMGADAGLKLEQLDKAGAALMVVLELPAEEGAKA